MSDFMDTFPKVRIISDNDNPMETRIFINDQEWSQWVNFVKLEFTHEEIAHITLGFYAKMDGQAEELEVSV